MLNGARSATLQRRLKIVDLIRRHEEMRVEDLAAVLGVSTVTIRSDLSYLDEQGLVLRRFGKATAPGERLLRRERPSRQEAASMLEDCAALVGRAQSLFLGPGDLPLRLIPWLRRSGGLAVCTVRLDAVPLARQCLDGTISLPGGDVGEDGQTLTGARLLAGVAEMLFDAAVFEVPAVDEAGALAVEPDLGQLAMAVASRTALRIGLVAGQAPVAQAENAIAAWTFDHLVLPADVPAASLDLLARQGFAARAWAGGAMVMDGGAGGPTGDRAA